MSEDRSDILEVARVIGEALSSDKPAAAGALGLLRGTVVSIEGDSCTVDILDSEVEQPGIYFLKNAYHPVIGESVWLIPNGTDYFILGRTGKGEGWHAYGSWIGQNGWYEGADGVIETRYRMVGGLCHFQFRVDFDGTILHPTDSLTLRLPFQALDHMIEQVGVAYYIDASSSTRYHGQCLVIDSTDPQYLYFSHEDAPFGVLGNSPFSWASGDSFGGSISYEIATPTPATEDEE